MYTSQQNVINEMGTDHPAIKIAKDTYEILQKWLTLNVDTSQYTHITEYAKELWTNELITQQELLENLPADHYQQKENLRSLEISREIRKWQWKGKNEMEINQYLRKITSEISQDLNQLDNQSEQGEILQKDIKGPISQPSSPTKFEFNQ